MYIPTTTYMKNTDLCFNRKRVIATVTLLCCRWLMPVALMLLDVGYPEDL